MIDAVNGMGRVSSQPLALLKPKPGQRVVITIQSESVFAIWTHWHERRLWCCGDGCPACGKLPVRLLCFVVASLADDEFLRPFLVETSAAAMTKLQESCDSEGIALATGAICELRRRTGKSALHMVCVGQNGEVNRQWVPKYKLVTAAAMLAGLPKMESDEKLEDFFCRIQPMMSNYYAGVA